MTLKKYATVGGVLLGGRSVLLCKRAPDRDYYPGVWDVPGGHVHPGETVTGALVRELQEELGVTPTRFVRLAVVTATDQRECHIFGVLEWIGRPSNLQPEEHSELRWFALEQPMNIEWAHPDMPKVLSAFIERFAETDK